MANRNRRRRKHRGTLGILVVICIALAALIVYLSFKLVDKYPDRAASSEVSSESNQEETSGTITAVDDQSGSSSGSQTQTVTPEPTAEPLPQVTTISPDSIHSVYGYMVRLDDGATVLDKNATQRMYPASMTKVMTLLVAIENLPDLDEKLVVTTDVIAALLEQHSSMAGFAEGEEVTVRDLLYGVLLPSGGDACLTLANRIAGSEAAFVDLMNQKAAEMGLTGTHFVNSTGLHNDDHYSTCAEIARMFHVALQNETFYTIVTTPSYTCEPTEMHPEGLALHSTMFSSLSNVGGNTMPNGAVIMGGKTGTTDEAGYCLVSFGTFNDNTYILVTGLGQYNEAGAMYNIDDAVIAYSALQ